LAFILTHRFIFRPRLNNPDFANRHLRNRRGENSWEVKLVDMTRRCPAEFRLWATGHCCSLGKLEWHVGGRRAQLLKGAGEDDEAAVVRGEAELSGWTGGFGEGEEFGAVG
jgi:hypothetical protein